MTELPAWLYFAGMTMLIGIAHAFAHRWPVREDGGAVPGSFAAPLEGLRGILATSVFFHHASISLGFVRTGDWAPPESRFYALLGPTPVTLFFFITGFLFWSKGQDSLQLAPLARFYFARAARILIPFWASLAPIGALILLYRTFDPASVPGQNLLEVVRSAGHWMLLGLSGWGSEHLLGFARTNLVNGGVTWTLALEMLFYLIFPFLGIWAKRRYWFMPLAAGVFLNYALGAPWDRLGNFLICGFFFGIAASEIRRSLGKSRIFKSSGIAVAALAIATLQIRLIPNEWIYTLRQSALLFPLFLIVACGNDLFGLLSLKGTQLLGRLSYSFYLIHGLVLFAAFQITAITRYSHLFDDPWANAARVLAAALVALVMAALFHRFVEAPAMALSRHAKRAFGNY